MDLRLFPTNLPHFLKYRPAEQFQVEIKTVFQVRENLVELIFRYTETNIAMTNRKMAL